MTYEEVSNSMNSAVMQLSPAELPHFLSEHSFSSRPFTDFMRQTFKEKKIPQKEVFIKADLDDRYGYKLISVEKQTQKRDTILHICLAAEFTLEETQEALILYGMGPLYEKIRRDTVFIIAFCNRINDIHEVVRYSAKTIFRRSFYRIRIEQTLSPEQKKSGLPPVRGQYLLDVSAILIASKSTGGNSTMKKLFSALLVLSLILCLFTISSSAGTSISGYSDSQLKQLYEMVKQGNGKTRASPGRGNHTEGR